MSPALHFHQYLPQAVCPPALLTHRLMSQGREEERRRLDEERRKLEEEKRREEERRGRGENSRRQEKGCRDERPLYESIYSLAGSPGGICPPTKSTLDQLHPLQLQVAPHLSTFISKLLTLHKKGDYSSHPLIFVQFMPVCSC